MWSTFKHKPTFEKCYINTFLLLLSLLCYYCYYYDDLKGQVSVITLYVMNLGLPEKVYRPPSWPFPVTRSGEKQIWPWHYCALKWIIHSNQWASRWRRSLCSRSNVITENSSNLQLCLPLHCDSLLHSWYMLLFSESADYER